MRVLVTGGGGFLGSWICRALLSRGDEVIAFQRSAIPELEAEGVRAVCGNIDDAGAVLAAMTDVDAVIHVAGKAGAGIDPAPFHLTNVVGTRNVIEACRKAGVRWLVYTSSPSVAHAGGDIEGGDESLPYPEHFQAPYPETKAAAEQLVLAANGEALRTVSLRPHLVWGPGDNHLLPRLLERAASGVLRLPGPDKLIDSVYVENAAAAHLLALDTLKSDGRCAGQAYFITNGEPLPQREIIGRLLEAAGKTADIRGISPGIAHLAGGVCEWTWKLTGRSTEPPLTRWAVEQLSTAHWYDIGAARRDLGYEPAVSINDGLQRLHEALRP
jgi:nucleoside-diphosphate-sugar epimerase